MYLADKYGGLDTPEKRRGAQRIGVPCPATCRYLRFVGKLPKSLDLDAAWEDRLSGKQKHRGLFLASPLRKPVGV